MRFLGPASLLIGLASALPQAASCATTTSEIIVPTSTYTFLKTDVVTIHATGPRDLGTFTDVTTIRSTSTLATLTTTFTTCTASGTMFVVSTACRQADES